MKNAGGDRWLLGRTDSSPDLRLLAAARVGARRGEPGAAWAGGRARAGWCAWGVLVAMLVTVQPALPSGEPVNGFPSWSERVILEWSNRARCDPQVEMTICGTACADAPCYAPIAPLAWRLALNRAARFHADEMLYQSYFAHDSICTVVSNIDSLYPASCAGQASCACVGGSTGCSPTCTTPGQRVALFGSTYGGEIIASPSDPSSAFSLWIYEPTTDPTCTFTYQNGHRWLILKSTGSMGAGVSGDCVGDFGSGGTPERIPSGSHYPRQASSVEAWVNWYDTAGPTEAWVNVGGTCHELLLERGTAQNGAWSATVTGVGSGCHRYYFEFRDHNGDPVSYPTTGSFGIGPAGSCADWTTERPPTCIGAADLIFADGFETGTTGGWSGGSAS